ncbi:Leucyl aminopeptidase (aminopeptidase T) [Anaerocolumna xylanovorans DSM 12503]|uniref:Leucyl aminopeptidase (Aminopeptidase T) n=2 Tax=Anaerocolumna TaxID=1843210 RepID=A0A1M7YDD4_9FIRM|nr:aminopeptidase [Anaerocolumna xylanovorans]SHO50586.1 Leucyl aminopeptidase (aminopeptidase T) [Anaerocolumna xylanovorans DSM 12503]
MKYRELMKEENDAIRERYELALERIKSIKEEDSVKGACRDYFIRTAAFIEKAAAFLSLVEKDSLKDLTIEKLSGINRELYEDILPENYEESYANPTYAVLKLGKKYGRLLSYLYAEIRGMIVYAAECRLFSMTIYLELFIEIYNYFEEEDEYTFKDVKRAIYDFNMDYCSDIIEYRTRELLDEELSLAADIIEGWDLTDLRYLYQFGEYIGENEKRIAMFLNSLPEDEIKAMAFTYTDGYYRGFLAANIDLTKKKTVNIRYNIGFERMVKYAVRNFAEMGLKPVIYRTTVDSMNKKQHLRLGYHSCGPNYQYDYDHRFDIGLYMDKAFHERRLQAYKAAFEKYKEKAALYAGPALIQVFGEKNFAPQAKEEAVKLDKRQQKLSIAFQRDSNMIYYQYIKGDETSFTIIAYPITEIGGRFEEIFRETVKVNTLDNDTYKGIQQKIIDCLDKGEYVRVKGGGNNRTDLKVMLYELQNPEKETIFENCTADVNIPVGEVFTSPKLTGTNGTLNVSRIFLNGLEYVDLSITFMNGMITGYGCGNFTSEEENKRYMKENILYNQDTLPIGEFAIGTNTTAYVMAGKYGIWDKLPILIAEKTGPHFAVGDTCYKMSEELDLFNPDGKKIVAKDNEVSILRKTEIEKAYFNCHTDITIPYDELAEITVVEKSGKETVIIRNGRFVLAGTEVLNEAFS